MQFASGSRLIPVAVLLLDREADRLLVRSREDLEAIAGQDDGEVLQAIFAELATTAAEASGNEILRNYEDTLSNTLRMTVRRTVPDAASQEVLDRLYHAYVVQGG